MRISRGQSVSARIDVNLAPRTGGRNRGADPPVKLRPLPGSAPIGGLDLGNYSSATVFPSLGARGRPLTKSKLFREYLRSYQSRSFDQTTAEQQSALQLHRNHSIISIKHYCYQNRILLVLRYTTTLVRCALHCMEDVMRTSYVVHEK